MGIPLALRMKLDFHLQVMTSMVGTPHQMAPVQVMSQVHQSRLIQLQLCMRNGVVFQAQVVWLALEKVELKLPQ